MNSIVSINVNIKNTFNEIINSSFDSEVQYLQLMENLDIKQIIINQSSDTQTINSIIQLLRFSAEKNFFTLFLTTLNYFLTSIHYVKNKKSIYKLSQVKTISHNYSFFLEKFVLQKNNLEFLKIDFFQNELFYNINILNILKFKTKSSVVDFSDELIDLLENNIQNVISAKKYTKISLLKIENVEFLKIKDIFKILDFTTISTCINFLLSNNINDPIINKTFKDIDIHSRTQIFNDLLFYIAQKTQNESILKKVNFLMDQQFHADIEIVDKYLNNEKVRCLLFLHDF